MSHTMHTTEADMTALYNASETMLNACPVRTLDSIGSIDVAQATLLVVMTMQAENRTDIAYAIEKPHKFPEYWVPALATRGKLYDRYGNRLYNAQFGSSDSWDFDIDEDYFTFSIKVKDEDEE